MKRWLRSVLPLAVAAGCSDANPIAALPDAVPNHPWPKPPTGQARAYPPHAIRSNGVGPYLVDAPLSDILHALPEGPRVELLELPGVVDWRLVRSDGDKLLIGADAANRVGFVVVLDAEVARTDSGMSVGRTGSELTRALGSERKQADIFRDHVAYEFDSLPGVHFVSDASHGTPAEQSRVIAVMVMRSEAQRPQVVAKSAAACRSGGSFSTAAELLAFARLKVGPKPLIHFGCFSGTAPEAVMVGAGALILVGGERGRLRRVGAFPHSGERVLVLDIDEDGRDEIVLVAHRVEPAARALELRALRWDSGRLVPALSKTLYKVSQEQAAAAGVTPNDIDLSVAIGAQGGALVVGGLYATRSQAGVRVLVPLITHRLHLPIVDAADLSRSKGRP